MKLFINTILCLLVSLSIQAQEILVEGNITDNQNNRKLTDVEILVTEDASLDTIKTTTDKFGNYSIMLNIEKVYTFLLERVAFENMSSTFSTKGLASKSTTYNMSMQRLPGYEFQADVRELLSSNSTGKELGKELQNLKIEIYNNSANKEIRVTEDDPKNTFEVNFERNNHYTMLIRKKGYYAKRIEVFVDIQGCVLCFEGLGNDYAPEIEDAMESGNERGVLIADIPMKKIVKDEAIRLENIYYDYDKYVIRPDARPALNKLVDILRSNPIIIELGSHTDSRGTDEYNMNLSDKRAKSAVDYIVSKGIKSTRISSKGYGESQPLNHCTDGVDCTDEEFQFNRRTEFKVTSFVEGSSFDKKSLKQLLEEERLNKKRSIEQLNGI